MRISNVIFRSLAISIVACGLTSPAFGQVENSLTQSGTSPTVIVPPNRSLVASAAAGRTDLYCAGYIQYAPAPIGPQIVGGQEEQEQHIFTEGDQLFIGAGANQGVRVGQEFQVVRPRGQVTSKFSAKKGWLGVYVQELGQLRVTNVRSDVSVATVVNSCDTILVGDLLRQMNNRVAPIDRAEVALDRFADPTGKQTGRIVLARDAREMVTRDQIVYIDLGVEDNIKAGDYFTVYRPSGTGNLTRVKNEEIARSQSGGFESDRYRGGKFSSQAQRTKDYTNTPGVFFRNEPVTTHEVRKHRPAVPRMVVGELLILHVQTRTATAIITRVAQEIHTGDFVELQ